MSKPFNSSEHHFLQPLSIARHMLDDSPTHTLRPKRNNYHPHSLQTDTLEVRTPEITRQVSCAKGNIWGKGVCLITWYVAYNLA